ncbi:MAG: diguanylate cyclase [Candidatus Thiodiazotropha sp. 6PLUC1]
MKSRQLFQFLTLLIFISDLIFVGINYYASQRALNLSLSRNGENLKHSYDLTLDLVYESMLQLATYVSNQKQIQQLFLAGKEAVSEEGGGAGGLRAAEVRGELYRVISPSWLPMMEQYDARQLQFHLGPGSLSFLRVHQPQKFGDRMDEIRHIIVDSYRDQETKIGFEVGRVYAGLRGVTPVWSEQKGEEKNLIGVLEVGTSYQTVLEKINRQTGVETMVLLNEPLVHSAMWPESIKKRIVKLSNESSCYVEAISNPIVAAIVENCEELMPYKSELRTFNISHKGRVYAITHFPLYDYQANASINRKQGGMVVMLMDVSDEFIAFKRQLQLNLIYGVVGFVVIEILLYLGIIYGSRRLHRLVDQQTLEIHQLKEFYKARSERDGLTALYNHRFFNERLQPEMQRAQRAGSNLSLMMCDLDDFKAINDKFGHLAGDEVLQGVASIIRELVRSSDFAGRYGGEEFIVALPETHIDDAVKIAQRLIESIASFESSKVPEYQVTASIGVAIWDGQQNLSGFIHSADQALYQAKLKGKNRVEREANAECAQVTGKK